MLSIPQGESKSFGLADVSKVAAPLELFRVTLRFAPLPEEVDSGITLLETAKGIVSSVKGSLQNILRYERERLVSQVEGLMEIRRGSALRDHIERVEKAIDAVSIHLHRRKLVLHNSLHRILWLTRNGNAD